MSDFRDVLNAFYDAGYDYTSEWIGDWADRDNMLAKLTLKKGRRKVGEWWGKNPGEAAEKARNELGITIHQSIELPL